MKCINQLFSIAVFLFLPLLANAQSKITGSVTSANEVIPYAHILLYQASDSSFLKGAVSDDHGYFEMFHSASGDVFLKTETIGYEDYYSQVFVVKAEIDIGKIVVREGTEYLEDVVVSATKPLYEQKFDRTIVNVQSSPTNAGNSVLNVLSKSPKVMVNRSTNQINLMGKEGVMVMINNKQVRMEPADLVAYLESLSADNIETIELITAPPARYEANGNAGIININTIRSEEEGFTGRYSLNAGYGERSKFGGSLNLNFNHKRWYSYANLSSSNDYTAQRITFVKEIQFPEEHTISELYLDRKPRVSLHSGEFGLDYKVSDQTTIGLVLRGNSRDWEMESVAYTDIDSNLSGLSSQITNSYEENKFYQLLANLNLRHQFSESMKINLDYDNIRFKRNNPSNYDVLSLEGNQEVENSFISSAKTPLSIHVVKVDLQKDFNENIGFETGFKSTLSDFTNDVRVANQEGDEWIDDPAFTDIFKMNERLFAGYVSGNWQITPQLDIKAGLRYEHYELDLSSDNSGKIIDRTNGRPFPSAYVGYQANDDFEMSASYVRRVERPGFLVLAPFFYYLDPNTLLTGNPRVIPTISRQYQLDFRYKSITSNIQYTDTRNPIFDFHPSMDQSQNLFVISAQQLSGNKVFSFNTSIPFDVTSWWSGSFGLALYHRLQNSIEGMTLVRHSNNFDLNMTQEFNLANDIAIETVAFYNSGYHFGVLKVGDRYGLDLGIRKKFSSGAALSFHATDLFNSSSQWELETDIREEDIFYDWFYNGEGSVFRLSFSMPFGNQNIDARDKRNSGSLEELQRIN